MRINQVARKYGIDNKDILHYLETIGMPGKSHSSSLDDGTLELLLQHFGKLTYEKKETVSRVSKKFARIRRPKGWKEREDQPSEEPTQTPAEIAADQDRREPVVTEPSDDAVAARQVEPEVEIVQTAPSAPVETPTATPTQEYQRPSVAPTQEASRTEARQPRKSEPVRTRPAKKKDKLKTITLAPKLEPAAQPEIIIEAPEVTPEDVVDAKPVKEPVKGEEREDHDQIIRREIQKLKQKQRRVTEKDESADKKAAPRTGAGGQRRRPAPAAVRSKGKRAWKREKRERRESMMAAEEQQKIRDATILKVHDATTVADIANGLGVPANELIAKLISLGVMVTINQRLDMDAIQIIADEYGFGVEQVDLMDSDIFTQMWEDDIDENRITLRPPVVTVMGHVDHGKTKLLDAVRSTDVVSQEAGGITQHIGAYYVKTPQGDVVFLDTPGHQAFTAMRARGAMVTDIVILVVSATEGVMPQTVEAIHHAKAANVPVIVAMNKMDLENANPDRIKQQLAQYGLPPEEWGGDTVYVPISAKENIGIPDLIEAILLQAEMLELKADPGCRARGTIIEGRLEQGRGSVATVLIQQGTLRIGDPFVTGVYSGRVRAIVNDRGEMTQEAGPAMPVEISGLEDVPSAGDPMIVVKDDSQAKQISARLQQIQRERELRRSRNVTLEDLHKQILEGEIKELQLIIKGDVQGSVDAVGNNLLKIESDKIRVVVLHSGVGAITESDVMLASASNALIIGFNVRPQPSVVELAKREHVDIRTYQIIYEAIDDIRKAMTGMLDKTYIEKIVGRGAIREVFKVGRGLSIAGSYVEDGSFVRNAKCRLLRDSVVVHDGRLSSLKRFKEDAREVKAGMECGVGFEHFQDIRVGDVLELYELEEVAPTL